MTKKINILIASTQYPHFGGAATNAYALIKGVRSVGNNKVAGMFIDKKGGDADPDNIKSIVRASQDQAGGELAKKEILSILGAEPDIILAKNYVAPVYCKNLFPKSKVVYLVSGCPHMMELSKSRISARRYIGENKMPVVSFPAELQCLKSVDFVIPNSPLLLRIMEKNYEKNNDIFEKFLPPVDTSGIINDLSYLKDIEWKKRKFDVAFISSNFDRQVKNAKFAGKILSDPSLKNVSKIIVGKNHKMFGAIPNSTISDSVPHKEIINILCNTKLLICPSFFDASPNIVREAIACGCNVLISKNCGWSERFAISSVCDDVYDNRDWLLKIHNLLGTLPDQKTLGTGGAHHSVVEDLLKIIEKII